MRAAEPPEAREGAAQDLPLPCPLPTVGSCGLGRVGAGERDKNPGDSSRALLEGRDLADGTGVQAPPREATAWVANFSIKYKSR